MPKQLQTKNRKILADSIDRATKRLFSKGWRYDGLWWWSPYTKNRYYKQEALSIEEIRKWSSGKSAFLNDKGHSIWVQEELDDNALITMEEASDIAKKNINLKNLGKLSK